MAGSNRDWHFLARRYWAVCLFPGIFLAACDMPGNDSRSRDEGYQWAASHQISDEGACTEGAPATNRARAIMEGCLRYVRQHQGQRRDAWTDARQADQYPDQENFDLDDAMAQCAGELGGMDEDCISQAERMHGDQAIGLMRSDAAMRQADSMSGLTRLGSPRDLKAGYAWAEENFVTDGDRCWQDSATKYFREGCLSFVAEHLGEGADDDH